MKNLYQDLANKIESYSGDRVMQAFLAHRKRVYLDSGRIAYVPHDGAGGVPELITRLEVPTTLIVDHNIDDNDDTQRAPKLVMLSINQASLMALDKFEELLNQAGNNSISGLHVSHEQIMFNNLLGTYIGEAEDFRGIESRIEYQRHDGLQAVMKEEQGPPVRYDAIGRQDLIRSTLTVEGDDLFHGREWLLINTIIFGEKDEAEAAAETLGRDKLMNHEQTVIYGLEGLLNNAQKLGGIDAVSEHVVKRARLSGHLHALMEKERNEGVNAALLSKALLQQNTAATPARKARRL